MRTRWTAVLILLAAAACQGREISNLQARHVAGQTFLTWDEKELEPKDRLAVYKHDEPITVGNLDRAVVLCRDLMPGTSCDFSDLRREKYRRFGPLPKEKVRGAVVPWDAGKDDGGKPVPHRIAAYNGLYVHSPAAAGKACYAVVVCDDDGKPKTPVAPGASSLTEPVVETTTDFPKPIMVFDTWKSTPESPEKCRMYVLTAAIGIFQNDKKAMADLKKYNKTGRHYILYGKKEHGWREGLPFHFSIYGEGAAFTLFPDDSNFAFMGFDNAWWFGVNDNITRPDELADGLVRLTHQARLLGLIDWACRTYRVDRGTISGGGSSMGGTGALLFILRHPDVFNRVGMGVPAVNLPELPNVRNLAAIIWGPMDKPVRCAEGGTVWEALNATKYLKEHPAVLPFMRITHGRKDKWMRWEPNPAFYDLLTEQGQPCVVLWDGSGHSGAKAPEFREAVRKLPRLRKDEPFLAFAGGSRNGDYGDGGVEDGDITGTLNLGYWFDNLAETKTKVTAEYWFERLGETDGGTVDILPYRLQKFPHARGDVAAYRILDGGKVVAEGRVTASARGLFRIPSAPCDKRYTFELTPAASDK